MYPKVNTTSQQIPWECNLSCGALYKLYKSTVCFKWPIKRQTPKVLCSKSKAQCTFALFQNGRGHGSVKIDLPPNSCSPQRYQSMVWPDATVSQYSSLSCKHTTAAASNSWGKEPLFPQKRPKDPQNTALLILRNSIFLCGSGFDTFFLWSKLSLVRPLNNFNHRQ